MDVAAFGFKYEETFGGNKNSGAARRIFVPTFSKYGRHLLIPSVMSKILPFASFDSLISEMFFLVMNRKFSLFQSLHIAARTTKSFVSKSLLLSIPYFIKFDG